MSPPADDSRAHGWCEGSLALACASLACSCSCRLANRGPHNPLAEHSGQNACLNTQVRSLRGNARKLPKASPSPQPGVQPAAPSSQATPPPAAAPAAAAQPPQAPAAEAMQLGSGSDEPRSSATSAEASGADASAPESSGGSWDSPEAGRRPAKAPRRKVRAQGRKLYRPPAEQRGGKAGPPQPPVRPAGPHDLTSPPSGKPGGAAAAPAPACADLACPPCLPSMCCAQQGLPAPRRLGG